MGVDPFGDTNQEGVGQGGVCEVERKKGFGDRFGTGGHNSTETPS
jgi:hypothetical protein